MKRTKEEMSEMTRDKENSKKTADKLVMDELLEMGFSYKYIGTHLLHDSIILSTKMRLEDYEDVNGFCADIASAVRKKYSVDRTQYTNNIRFSIENALTCGNIDYILDIFKNSYDKDRMVINKNAFIMTIRRKLIPTLAKEESYNANQLRLIIQGGVEEITDYNLLKGICDIVLSVGGRSLLSEKGGVV